MHQDSGQDTQQTPFYYISGATDAAFPGTAQQPASRAAGAGTPQYASQRQQQQAGQQQALAAQPIVRWASGQQQQFRVSPVVQAVGVQAAQPIQHLHIVAAQHNQAAAFLTTTGQLGQAAGWGGQPLASSSNTGFAVHGPTTLGGLQPVPIPRAAVSQRSSAQHSNEIIASLVQTLSTQSAAGLADLLSHALGQLDGRQCAAFLRECGHRGGTLVTRAWEVFNWLRSIPPGSPYSHLRGLLDVFTYTAMISMCAASKDVYTAFELSREMEQRGILLNVHTYSALMNVAVKAGRSQLALDTFQRMQQAGCSPNLVTYNTLIDVYGKLGLWADAIQVLSVMRDRGVEPVVRTYNTLMIACTISNRWQEALQVYQRMREAGLKPNTTTYNALISAYSKAGQLDKVMAVFAEMVEAGCERSVITYSTLIAACERCGQWETALQLFARMPADGCQPNTITYNSLITACAQGMQWQLALQLFDQMVAEGHTPDVVSYTALISACGKGCQWRRALQAFSRMQSQGCQPDHIIYETMVEALWATGVRVPQLRAVQLYRSGMQQGLMRHIDPPLRSSPSPSASPSGVPVPGSADSAEISISSGNPVMLSLGLQVLLLEHMERVLVQGAGALPGALVVRVGGKGRARDPTQHSNLMAALRGWLRVNRCPLQLTSADGHGGLLRLVSTRGQLAEWLQGPAAEAALSRLMVPIPAGGASGSGSGGAWLQRSASQQDAALQQQEARYASMETWCVQAFHIIHQYEAVHRLSVAAMSPAYLDARPDLLNNLACVGEELQVPSEQVYDALLLTDRAMAGGLKQLPADQFFTALLAALLIVSKQASPGPPMLASGSGAASSRFLATAGRSASGTRLHGSASAAGAGPSSPLTGEQVASIAGVPMAQLQGMQATLRTTLAQGTAAVSAVHSLRMYHFCLGYSTGAIPTPGKVAVSPVVPDSPSSVSTGQPSLVPRSSGGPSTTASGMEGGIKGGATLTEPAGFGTMRPGQPRFGDFPEQGDGLGPLPDFSSLSLAERPSATAAGAAATAATGAASVAEAPRSNPLATALLLPRETETKLSAQPRLGPTATSPAALQQQPSLLAAQSQLMSSPIGSPVGITAISVPSPATSSGGAIAALGLSADDMELCSYQLMHLALGSRELLKLRPSVLAAAALHGARLLHGHLPLWPTALVQLTGGMDVTHPELATAITLVARLGV